MLKRFSALRTLSRVNSSFREVSNFFQPDIPIERSVMKTSIAGLAEALEDHRLHVDDNLSLTSLVPTFQGKKRLQPEQLSGQILQLLLHPQAPSGSCHCSEIIGFNRCSDSNAICFGSFAIYLDKKVKPAHSDGLIDKVATLGALKPIRIVHQVWKIELKG